MASASDIVKRIKDEEIEWVDLRFTDPKGKWQHLSMCAGVLDEDQLEEGLMFDGSSIEGWKTINESDMILKPDLDAAYVDPFSATPMLVLVCDIVEPSNGELYARDPRSTAKRAEAYLKTTGIGDTVYVGPEARILHVRRCAFRGWLCRFGFPDRRCRTADQHRHRDGRRQHGPPPARQGRLLPCRAGRPVHGHPRRNGEHDDRNGPAHGQASPRSGGRAARAGHHLRHAGGNRRPRADLQVRGPASRACLRQDRDFHAQADQGR